MVCLIKLDILSYYMRILQRIAYCASYSYLHCNKLLSSVLKLSFSVLFVY